MSAYLNLACDGCDAFIGPNRIDRSLGPKLGPSLYARPTAEGAINEATPAGWVAFEPWTYCTYCPDCWEKVTAPEEPAEHGGAA